MLLSDDIVKLSGVGPVVAKHLKTRQIDTVLDLLFYIPRRYDDYSNIVPIKTAKPGQITVRCKLERVSGRYGRRGLHITEAIINDGTGKLKAIWFNQPYRANGLPKDAEVYIAGKLERVGQGFALNNPSVERVSDFTKSTARIVPTYPETRDLSSSLLRRIVPQALEAIPAGLDPLPPAVIEAHDILPWPEAIREVHFPTTLEQADKARHRLAFDELFALMLAHGFYKRELSHLQALPVPFDVQLARKFVGQLPFSLTDAQRRAAWEILQDLEKTQPMNRLLQGDVGSGKTVVAAFAMLMAAKQDVQSAIMAPTEVLARQHFATLSKLLEPFEVACALLVGGKKDEQTLAALRNGRLPIVVGTHALIQKGIKFKHLGLIVVDEQHRFGVRQRQTLVGKGAKLPHVLSMSATPIPRSLMLTIHGELDVSVIDELPPGRQPVETHVISGRERAALYQNVDKELVAGRQAYIVCPLIEDSDVLGVKSVTSEYERLNKTVFGHRRIGLLHGKLKSAEKERVLDAFKSGELDILVSTTVVEVGVDVPNATVLIVEGAERFGLAQLHQLRGRVGRGEHQSYCYLLTTADSQSRQRLAYLERTQSGFELAEADLQLRGPGELYGTHQHGELDLRIAKLTDTRLISEVQRAVKMFITDNVDLSEYPLLEKRVSQQRVLAHLN